MSTPFKNHPGNFSFTVHPLQADFKGKFSVIRLCEIILESASQHAASLGFGFQEMQSAGTAWVLTRLAIQVEQYANVYDELYLETWVDSVKSSFSTRKFNVFKKGEIIASATSVWMLIDVKSRRPAPIDVELFKKHVDAGRECLIDLPKKVDEIRHDVEVVNYKVAYSDIDLQGHVHSGKYIEWMLNLFLKEQFLKSELQRIDVNYLAECFFEDEVRIFKTAPNENKYIVDMEKADGKSVCRAWLEWR